jgi:hypothetical protein
MEAERQEPSLHLRGLFQARKEEGFLMGVGPPSNGRPYQTPVRIALKLSPGPHK